MKTKKLLSLLIAIGMIMTLSPFAAFADGEQTRTMQIVVNAGETVSVWNTNIAASGITSNTITVLVEDGTSYDIMFPEAEGTAAALSYYTVGIDAWQTPEYIKADIMDACGMLVWITVHSGAALLTVESTGTGLSEEPLTPYIEDVLPIDYYKMSSGQTAVYWQSESLNLSNMSLAVCGTADTEIKRTDVAEDGYELFRFTRDNLLIDSYNSAGSKDCTLEVPYTSVIAADDLVYYCAPVLLPLNNLRNSGSLNVTSGKAIIAVPAYPGHAASQTVWSQSVYFSGGDLIGEYFPLLDTFFDNAANEYRLKTGNIKADADSSGVEIKTQMVILDEAELIEQKFKKIGNDIASNTNSAGTREKFIPMAVTGCTPKVTGFYPIRVNLRHYALPHRSVYDEMQKKYSYGGASASSNYTSQDLCYITVCGGTTNIPGVRSGGSVTITATVPAGQRFIGWTCNKDLTFSADAPTQTVSVGENTGDVVFTAHYEPLQYGITLLNAVEGGSVTPDKETAAKGETVSVSVSPDPGYAISSLKGYSDEYFDLTQSLTEPNVYTFTMPEKAVELSAAFAKLSYSVTTSSTGYGSVTADRQTAKIGDTVTLTVTPESEHQHLGALTVRCGSDEVATVKESDGIYTFTMPAGDVSAHAAFATNRYVYFVNYNGVTLQWGDLAPGQMPVYRGETPVREQNEMYSFAFAGWDKEIVPVSDDAVYTATYTMTPRSYTVSFLGADGSVLQSGSLQYGTTPSYAGATPVKATDDDFVYTFSGWSPAIASVTGEATYTPVFDTVPVLHMGRNSLEFQTYETKTCPFTPEESGYYRFWTTGDAIRPQCSFKNSAGNNVTTQFFTYLPFRDMHFEFVSLLEAGETYNLGINSYQTSGKITLHIADAQMHTVTCDPLTLHGTVGDPEEPTFMAYTGQIITPYATPDSGYGIMEMRVTDSDNNRYYDKNGGYSMPDRDLFVTATFAPAQTIDFDTDSSVTRVHNDAVYDDWSGDDLTERAAEGVGVEYTFEWDEGYVLSDFSIITESGAEVPFDVCYRYLNMIEIWFTMPDEPVTITVHTAEAYEIVFAPGYPGGISIKGGAEKGEAFDLPECPFKAPAGMVFDGWTATEGGAVQYRAGDSFTSSADTILYAVWRPREFTETTVTKNAGNTVCDVALNNTTGPVTVIAAAYLNGVLVTAEPRVTSQSSETFTFTGNPDMLKVFVFDNLNNIKPLSVVEEKSLK